ncbi:hypothetical protein OV079_06980 [Nannocystis pusilla]|uniref:TolB protein n=1 Tax=Nannocystis pusilla TaxID=889268 RepID=A0A9X3IVX3_9BACT|nr:hypothetical protein [Nannocystis pusilla]MCY1005320.1 hypothetical protein [Nannocystis pusilla]
MRWNFVALLSAAGLLACGNPDRPAESDSFVISASTSLSTGNTGNGSDTTDTATPTSTDPSGSGTMGDPTEGPVTGTTNGTTVDPATTATTGEDPGMVVSIEIDPLDAIITVVDGVIPPSTQYSAVGITDKGIKIPVTGTWSYDKLDLAGIGDLSGTFTATGFAGGVGTVTFEGAGELPAATTTATVKLLFNAEPNPVPPETKDLFPMAVDPDPSMVLLYPYDKTVFPRGLIGPTIQWDGGGANDLYYIHAYSEFFEYKGWHGVPPPSRFDFPKLPTDIWLKLTASTEGDVKVDIARFDGQKAYLAKTQTWTIAPANLTGTVYYWEVNNGNVVRLNIGATAPEQFIQKPPGVTCVACHSVSKDGSRIAASFHGGYSPWSTIDAASGNVLYFPDIASGFQAIAPNGSHVVWGQSDETGALKLTTFDSSTVLAQLTVPGGKPQHPVWSSDGTKVAFARKTDGNWLDFNNSELWLVDIDLMTNSFANAHQIVDKIPGLTTTTFPTFSPDSQWIAFNRLNQARTRAAVTEVWLTSLDGSAVVRLDKANGFGIVEPGQDQTTYEPTFLPVSVGGYSWLIIGSERKYGNTLTDTNPNTRRKQLWVTAIDGNITPGTDPSHPAFWLPGQELNNSNMRGEWALSPCKQLGEGCNAGFDCCDGFCYGDPAVCSDKPDTCSHIGDSCEVDAACCEGEGTCIAGYCSIQPG